MIMTTMMLFAGLVLMCLAVFGDAHLCLISPHQRGSMDGINKAGVKDCLLLKGPCGGRKEGPSAIGLSEGENFVVTWQKNLDHFDSAKPGYFNISIGANESNMTTLHKTPDLANPPLTLFFANVTVPKMLGNAVLQVTYVTDNPKAPAVFYQCADVTIFGKTHF